ncbi:MAG TPA: helical backbone metal receptor [Burkholderiaceae bacterium]|nr:helical backbone metal receptor [Burkholderiaceae bacterium]
MSADSQPRIVSLVPSLTELICELGLRDSLVGRTGFCIHPRESLRNVPKVGGTKDVTIERVRELAPTHLVVNVDENEKPTVDALAAFVPEVVVTHPIAVGDNRALIERFGRLFGREQAAAQLVERFDAALAALRARRFAPLPVVYLIWKDPWMTVSANTFIAKMLAEAGMQVVAPRGARYPVVELDWMRDSGARAVLLASEPYRFRDSHAAELAGQLSADGSRPALACLTIDGEMTSWYGSRAISGLRYLLEFRNRVDAQLADGKAGGAAPMQGTDG